MMITFYSGRPSELNAPQAESEKGQADSYCMCYQCPLPKQKIPLMDALKIIYPRAFKIVTQFPILGDSNQRRGYVNIMFSDLFYYLQEYWGMCSHY